MITQAVKKIWCPRVGGLMLAVGIGLMVGLSSQASSADQRLPMVTIGFQNGTITAVYQMNFQIDGRTFSLTPDAVLQDPTGKEIDATSLVVTAEVKYHLKKDQNDKIDRMVVYLPR